MAGPGDSQPNELDHEISFACSIASPMRSGSLRTTRKGGAEKGSFFALPKGGKMDGERGLKGPWGGRGGRTFGTSSPMDVPRKMSPTPGGALCHNA